MSISHKILDRIKANDPSLTRLTLCDKCLTDDDIIELCSVLASNTTLVSLDVSFNQIGAVGAKALANCKLKCLNISFNKIDDTGAQELANNTTLTSLYLIYCEISATGAQKLATNRTLRFLNISFNQIGDIGAYAFTSNTTMLYLFVRYCQIGAAGAQALANNSILRGLNITGNCIGNTGAQTFITNTTLTSIGIQDNQINHELQALIHNNIFENRRNIIRRLDTFSSILNKNVNTLPFDVVCVIGSFLMKEKSVFKIVNLAIPRGLCFREREMLIHRPTPNEAIIKSEHTLQSNFNLNKNSIQSSNHYHHANYSFLLKLGAAVKDAENIPYIIALKNFAAIPVGTVESGVRAGTPTVIDFGLFGRLIENKLDNTSALIFSTTSPT